MKGQSQGWAVAALLLLLSWPFPLAAQEERALTLQEVVKQVLAAHPLTQAARARVEGALGMVRQARAYPNPTFTFTHSDFTRERTYGLSQMVEWPGKRNDRIAAATAEERITASEQEKKQQDLIAAAREAFYTFLLTQEQSRVAETFVYTTAELQRSTAKLFQEGDVPEFEVIKAKVEVMKAEKDLEKVRSQRETARVSLNLLLGQAEDSVLSLDGSLLQLPVVPPVEELLIVAEEQNPLLSAQRQTMEKEKLNLRLAQAAVIPDLSIDVGRGEDLQAGVTGPLVGLSFSFPLWDRKDGAIAAARSKVTESEATLRATQLQVRQALLVAYRNWQAARGQVETFAKGLMVQTEKAAALAEQSYREGEGDLLSVLDAERSLLTVRRDYAQALFDRQMAWVAVEQAAGMGTDQ